MTNVGRKFAEWREMNPVCPALPGTQTVVGTIIGVNIELLQEQRAWHRGEGFRGHILTSSHGTFLSLGKCQSWQTVIAY